MSPIFRVVTKGFVGFGGVFGVISGNEGDLNLGLHLISITSRDNSITSRDISITSRDNLISLEDNLGFLSQ